jgi:hypothetical protein
MQSMHEYTQETDALAKAVVDHAPAHRGPQP